MSVTTFEAVIENGQIRLPVRGSSCPNGKSGMVPIAAAAGCRKVVSALSNHPSANSLPNCGM